MESSRLHTMMVLIDAANAEDPRSEISDGREYPKELLYARRMSEALKEFEPAASEELQIAARAQHIRRWEVPRSDYPMDRAGYLTWRRDLGRFHAEQTAQLMREAGYEDASIERVQALLTKRGIKQNPETQILEDVICLVFLRYYLTDFAQQQEQEKLISIIRKTWNKMSERGHAAALQLPLPDELSAVVGKALAPTR